MFLFLLLANHTTHAADYKVVHDSNKTRVLLSEEITFYGLDFSRLTLVNRQRMFDKKKIKNIYCPAWIIEFDETNSATYLRKKLKIENLQDKRYPFQSDQYLKREVDLIVSHNIPHFNIDSIKTVVSKYSLKQKRGIGLSFIITHFLKDEEEVKGYITFFDIGTRELLYVIESRAGAEGLGLTKHWSKGIHDAWIEYFIYDHPKYRRQAMKINR